MKSITISVLSIIILSSMSFVQKENNINLQKGNNVKSDKILNYKGVKNTIIIGTSATAFPGNINVFTATESNNSFILNDKINSIINKYQ